MGALGVVPMNVPRFKMNHPLSTTSRCVLIASHRIPLKEFTSLRKKLENRGGLFPVWGYPWVHLENSTTQSQAVDLFWRWVSLKNFTVQELNELREDRLLSYVLDQCDLRIKFAI
ncbi:LOW QUALITY PROTEIN: ATP-binding cassette (ABC) Superfamily [Phytophthora palmivora]|uniref:ATP-binding cassette (ABC) Superfamily n=1 Tax=Phytophthora palmivora TaxID=4796 RepID=A0A2P4XVD8_9STRA|nr:LOW QUALITY PROTEIN: ATP-binding cassette (ABC) Superfamily [Phytophthora palmivora]